MVGKDVEFFYKYNLEMSPIKGTLEHIYGSITGKHFEAIMSGKEQILISNVPVDPETYPYFLVVLDFDFKSHSAISLTEIAKNLAHDKLAFMNPIFETSPNGFHMIAPYLVKGRDYKVLSRYKEILKKYKIDLVSASQVPIFRVGSYRNEGMTMCPTDIMDIYNTLRNPDKIHNHKKPGEIFQIDEWKNIWKKFIIPEYEISEDNFFKALKS